MGTPPHGRPAAAAGPSPPGGGETASSAEAEFEIGPPREQASQPVPDVESRIVRRQAPLRVAAAEALQEMVRSSLALAFVIIFGLTAWAAFQRVGSEEWENTKELLQLLLPAETALIGGAVGFYFGTRVGGGNSGGASGQ